MKKKSLLPLVLLLLIVSTIASAQSGEATKTCHQKYAAVFEKRGAFPVKDGTHNDVIISFRKGSFADCFYGKVIVKNGQINVQEMYLKLEGDTYERVQRKYRYPKEKITIEGGMSRTMVTVDDELINVLFTKSIKPKKKAYVKAAEPNFDDL